MPTAAPGIRREHLETFIEAELARFRPSTAATRYRDLRQLFRWLLDEGEIDRNPMERMRPPKLDERPVPVVPDEAIRNLLTVCSGRSFDDRRDTAILFVLIDTGARLPEVADLRLDEDLDLEFNELHVTAGTPYQIRHSPNAPAVVPTSRHGASSPSPVQAHVPTQVAVERWRGGRFECGSQDGIRVRWFGGMRLRQRPSEREQPISHSRPEMTSEF